MVFIAVQFHIFYSKPGESVLSFHGTHNMASFMKYPLRNRLKTDSRTPTMRHMLHVGISGGKCNLCFFICFASLFIY